MGLTKQVLRRPVTTVLVVLCLIVFGLSSVFSSKLELTPEMEMPMLIVNAVYPGASPEDVEELVTKPIEDEISTLTGIDTITSMSSENMGMVLLQYEYGKDMDKAYDDLKKKLDGLVNEFPEDVQTPTIIEMDINDTAAITLAVNNEQADNLYNYVDSRIVPEFEKLSSVASVDVSGGQEEYIKVELIPEKLAQYHLNMNTIAQCVGSADFSMPIGSTTVGNKKLSVTSGTDFDTIELLKKIPITLGNGNIIYLEDVAEVYSTLEEKSSIGRYNGKDTIALGIKKNQESSNMEVSRDVLKIVDDLKADDPALEVVVINDSSESISSSLESVFQTMIMAVVVSMVIIWLFFGDMKASLIVGTSIPVSILAALILMKAMGFSLNVITLSSLVLGVGMMVDNSIVVLESCFRNTKQGGFVEARNAALDGTKAVLESIIGGTVTTCVVFIPLALIKGISGQMFKPLGFTIVFCMVASLISAMTIVPLCYTFYRPKEKTENPASRMLRATQDGYRSLVRKLMCHKALVMITSVVLLVLSFMMAGQLKMELMVADDPGIIGITVETQPGLTIDRVNDVLVKVEDYITKDADLDSYMLSYGSSGLSMGGSGASITAYLKDDKSRETDQVLKEWKRELQKWPDCSISLEKQSSLGSTMTMNQADQVSYILVSTQYDELKEVSDAIVEELQARPEVTHVHSSLENDAPLVKISVDPVKASAEGLAPAQVAGQVYAMLSGTEATTLNVNGNDLSVKVEYGDDQYDTIDKLQGIVLPTATGSMVALTDIAEIGFKESEYRSLGQAPLVFVVMAAQFESPKFSIMVMTTIPFSLIGAFGLLWLADSPISMVSLLGFLMLVGTVVNNGILYVDTANQYRNEMDLDEAVIEAGATRIRPMLMTTLTTIVAMIPMALAYGDAGEMMQGLALVDVGGLIASTVLALLMLPVYYRLMNRKPKEEPDYD